MAPGTACTAVGEGVLIPSLDGTYFPERPILDGAGNILVATKHATLAELKRHQLLSNDDAAALLKFTTVRNPFDALVTQYVRLRTVWRGMLSDPESFVHKKPGMIQRIHLACEIPTFSDLGGAPLQGSRAPDPLAAPSRPVAEAEAHVPAVREGS